MQAETTFSFTQSNVESKDEIKQDFQTNYPTVLLKNLSIKNSKR